MAVPLPNITGLLVPWRDGDDAALTPSGGAITRAEEVVPARTGHLLWASSRGDGTVKRIDLDAQAITGSVFIGAPLQPPAAVQPESVLLTPSEPMPAATLFAQTRTREPITKTTADWRS